MGLKSKLVLTSIVGVLGISLVGAATFALFNSQVTNNTNTFTAGTVDIDSYRDGFDTIPGPMFYTTAQEGATPTHPSYLGLKPTGTWVPGDTQIRSLVVYNKGSLDVALKQVQANIESDDANMASKMDVAVYKILPQKRPNGLPYSPLPGDDTLDQSLLDETSSFINPIILVANYFGASNLTQKLIEKQIPVTATMLWNGTLDQLAGDQPKDFSSPINLSKNSLPFTAKGTLLAFVVHLHEDAGNAYNNASAQFGFTVIATQQ